MWNLARSGSVSIFFGVGMALFTAGSTPASAQPPAKPRVQAPRRIVAPRVNPPRQGVAQPARRPTAPTRTAPVRPPVAIPAAMPAVVTGGY